MDLPFGWTLEEHADEFAFALLERMKRADAEEVEWLAVHDNQNHMELDWCFDYYEWCDFPREHVCDFLYAMRAQFVELARECKLEGRLAEVVAKVCEFYEETVAAWPQMKAEMEAEEQTAQ